MAKPLTYPQYLRRIRPGFLARGFAPVYSVLSWLDVVGRALETLRTNYSRGRLMLSSANAEGLYLDRLGDDRQLPRTLKESDDDVYREVLIGAYEQHQNSGNIVYLGAELGRYGFDVTIVPRWTTYGVQGPIYDRDDTWNILDLTLDASEGLYGMEQLINVIQKNKATREIYTITIGPGVTQETLDDGGFLDDGGTLDEIEVL